MATLESVLTRADVHNGWYHPPHAASLPCQFVTRAI
jgi:hypothetical protein